MFTPQIKTLLENRPIGETIDVWGWIKTRRDSGSVSFFELNDGSCLSSLQIIAEQGLENFESDIKKISTGVSVHVHGKLVESPAKGQDVELQAQKIKVVGWADPESYPLQKKRHSFEFLRTMPQFRPRTNALAAVARVRSILSFAVHRFFKERGFFHVHTPIITTSDCEGAGEMFLVTTLEPGQIKDKNAFDEDFFGRRAGLTVSGQLQAEIYAQALGRVYTFGPTFRAENSNTSRHLAEFWMIEPEMSFCDLKEDMDLAEEFITVLIKDFLSGELTCNQSTNGSFARK
jgi:asparaginyl-tRNA synthetase